MPLAPGQLFGALSLLLLVERSRQRDEGAAWCSPRLSMAGVPPCGQTLPLHRGSGKSRICISLVPLKSREMCALETNTCRSAKNWKQASSQQLLIHTLDRRWCFKKKPSPFLFPLPYFQALSSLRLHFPSAFPWWEWWYWSGGVGSSTATFGSCPGEMCGTSEVRDHFLLLGFPLQRELHWKEMSSQ